MGAAVRIFAIFLETNSGPIFVESIIADSEHSAVYAFGDGYFAVEEN